MNDTLLTLWIASRQATANLTSAQPDAPVVAPRATRRIARPRARVKLRFRGAPAN